MTIPSIRMPGTFATPPLAPVYVDGIPASQVTPVVPSTSQDFWSSQPRLAGDPAYEQLTVTLGQARLINYVALDLPHFPHTATFWWWDGSLWQPVRGGNGAPLVIVTAGSVPAVVDNPAALNARQNPYHYGAGHWVHYDEQVQPFTTTRLMLRAVRPAPVPGTVFPVSPAGKVTPYPLGVQNLDLGCRMTSSSQVPPMPRSPLTQSMRQPFTTTVDVNGSPVQVALRENRAGDLLAGGTWRCGPQPSSSSVTCLYLDSRDENGNAQVIDRLYLEPVTSGVRFNLYYSAAPPPAGTTFSAIDDPLLPGLLSADGAQLPAAAPYGIVFSQWPGWLTLSNQAAGTVADEPWWAGIEVMPAFSSDDPGTYVIADSGLIQLSYSGGEWTATMPSGPPGSPNEPSGGVLGQWAFSFSPGDRLQFTLGYDGQDFFAWSPLGSLFQSPAMPPVAPAPSFRFGGLQGIDPDQAVLAGNYALTAFVLKQEAPSVGLPGVPLPFLGFAADPSGYVSPPLSQDQASTVNAVARFHPDFMLGTVNPWGFVGGLGSAYEACSWIPVQRSYVLARGFLELDPVLAAAWKFEFTSLQPEPYEYLKPSQATSQYFAPQAMPTAEQSSPTSPAALDPGLEVNRGISPAIVFRDAPPPSPDPVSGVALANEALYASDPVAAAQMAALGGSLYNFQPWLAPYVTPVTVGQGASAYQEQTITVSSRVAYFVALSSVAMYRVDYRAADDTAQYTENFSDDAFIDSATLTPGGWAFEPGAGLVASTALPPGGAAVQSQVLNSIHAVTGVQFAAIQSDPVQLLDDADFSDPGFASWKPVGDALPLSESPSSAQLGIMAQVSRGSGAPPYTAQGAATWAYLQSSYASWAVLQAAIPAWASLGQPAATSAMGGIAYAGQPVPTIGTGRLYAAARVFSATALHAPLYLQVLDGATGTVIAEAEQSVSGGSVTEWFAGLTLPEEVASQQTWLGLTTQYPTWASATEAGLTWDEADTSESPLGATITVQLIQKDSTGDAWDVDNVSVFEDGLVWQFSNDGGATWYPAFDVRNNPRGVVTFPPAAPGAGNQLMWKVSAYYPGLAVSALAIRPWYVTWPRGIMPRSAGVGHGPNIAPLDHYAPVEDDPRWRASSSPVPDSWFFAVRQALGVSSPGSDFPGLPQPLPDAGLGAALVWQPPSAVPSAPGTYADIYADAYTDQYAPADGGDLFTDDYGDLYGEDYLVLTGSQRQGAASFGATGVLTAVATAIPLPAYGLGADLGPVAASDSSVAAWTSGTGLPVHARRIALGNQFPSSLAESPASGEAGVRRVLFDVRPDATTTPGGLDAFLASCQAGGLDASVSIWAGADTAFGNVQDWARLIPDYAAVVHRNGYRVVLTVDNHSVAAGWLEAWYPGDEFIDVIAPTFWCSGPAPGSGGDTLAVAQAFADAHGKPLGLAGTGVDHELYTQAQADAFITYLKFFFGARRAAARPSYDVIWYGLGNYSVITAAPFMVIAYRSLAQAL